MFSIFPILPCTKVDNGVILVNHWVQDPDQVEERHVEAHAVRLEPLPDEDNHWATQLVNSCLIKTPGLFYIGQIFLLGSEDKKCKCKNNLKFLVIPSSKVRKVRVLIIRIFHGQ